MAIIEEFKKGQLVPKRLGILFVHKEVRHTIVFNTEVRVIKIPNQSTVYVEAYPDAGESAILVKHNRGRKRENGTIQRKGMDIRFDNLFYVGKGTTIRVPDLDDVTISPKAIDVRKIY